VSHDPLDAVALPLRVVLEAGRMVEAGVLSDLWQPRHPNCCRFPEACARSELRSALAMIRFTTADQASQSRGSTMHNTRCLWRAWRAPISKYISGFNLITALRDLRSV